MMKQGICTAQFYFISTILLFFFPTSLIYSNIPNLGKYDWGAAEKIKDISKINNFPLFNKISNTGYTHNDEPILINNTDINKDIEYIKEIFSKKVEIMSSTVNNRVNFLLNHFNDDVDFSNNTFNKHLSFTWNNFKKKVRFLTCEFS